MIKRLMREPLVYFAALGLIIYALYVPGISDEDMASPTIELPSGFVADQRLKFEKQYGRPPTEQELNGLLDQAINDEILFREAWRLQLYVGDEVVRKRMIQKMRYILDETHTPEPASESQVDQQLAQRVKTAKPEIHFSLYHTVFADAERAANHLKRLAENPEHTDANPEGVIAFPLGNVFARLSLDESRRLFGSDFANSLQLEDANQWQGPIQSRYGFHVVKLDNISKTDIQNDADARESLRQDMLRQQQQRQQRKAIEDIRARYDIAFKD